MAHLRTCAIDIPEVLTFLHHLGVRRFEVSNTLQGVELKLAPDWNVTLHIPEVPVAISRHRCPDSGSQWLHPTFPVPLQQRDNMIYYFNNIAPSSKQLLFVDRVVYRIQN